MAMQCENHLGEEWPHEECAGPGMPWPCGEGVFDDHPPHFCDKCYNPRLLGEVARRTNKPVLAGEEEGR